MDSRKVLQSLTMVLLLMVSSAASEMSQLSKDKVNSGISGGQKVVEFLSKLGDPKTRKVFDSLGKMASFLGAAGGLISFALLFVPKSDSPELKFMKKKFAEVNQKLDIITTKLDNIETVIKFENQRSIYVASASKIQFGITQLSKFLNELETTPCSDEKNCTRVRARIASRYVEDFHVKQYIFKIINGAIKPTSVFGDPLLILTQKTHECDVGKIDHLANGILKLSFKAQQVILAHEKLTGSKISITQSMNDWLKSLYDLRDSTFNTKKQCFSKISTYMIRDINRKKYQVGVSSNKQANMEVKTFMETKYRWLGWIAYSYGAYGGSKHCVQNNYGAFWNMPSGQDNRKRNLIVTFLDKSGTYSNQKYKVLRAIDQIVASSNFFGERNDACKQLPKIKKGLLKHGVWKYVTSLNILRSYEDLAINADNELTYISEEYTLQSYHMYRGGRVTQRDKVRLVIVLRSIEMANGVTCDKSCRNDGSCATLPYSSAKYCQCKPYYQGENCEDHAKAQLALTMDSMLETTLKLPTLSDIGYEIKDLREYVGISFGQMQTAVSELEAAFKKAFDDISRKLANHFQWSNLITLYNNAIRKIEFYSYRFGELPKSSPKAMDSEGKKLATAVLQADGIAKWLYELNFLFTGRTGTPLVKHSPLMIIFMNRYSSQACTPAYKAAVDYTWRQLVLLQQMGFFVYAQALEFMGRPTEYYAKLYKTRTAMQASLFLRKTCEYAIPNSVNVQCTGGRYLHPRMTIVNQCKANYYITGKKETSCDTKTSGCSSCRCYAAGSDDMECSDFSGRCKCKADFYGMKCSDRNCVWAGWSAYSSCSKGCGYGGTQTRRRTHKISRLGRGKSCSGSSTYTKNCFKGCCKSKFHCSNRKKCIPLSYKCDYDNDCGDKQDEGSCSEACTTKYTRWNSHGGGDMVYFDRHRLNCGGHGNALKMFHLQRNGGKIRFQFICCKLNKKICKNKKTTNGFTKDGDGDTVYLDRQRVNCGDYGYLNDFRLERNSRHNRVRYSYYCCNLRHSKHRSRTSCYTSYTRFTYDGNGKSYYLDRQTVKCRPRYFLTYFRLVRNSNHDRWRYIYRCCQVRA